MRGKNMILIAAAGLLLLATRSNAAAPSPSGAGGLFNGKYQPQYDQGGNPNQFYQTGYVPEGQGSTPSAERVLPGFPSSVGETTTYDSGATLSMVPLINGGSELVFTPAPGEPELNRPTPANQTGQFRLADLDYSMTYNGIPYVAFTVLNALTGATQRFQHYSQALIERGKTDLSSATFAGRGYDAWRAYFGV